MNLTSLVQGFACTSKHSCSGCSVVSTGGRTSYLSMVGRMLPPLTLVADFGKDSMFLFVTRSLFPALLSIESSTGRLVKRNLLHSLGRLLVSLDTVLTIIPCNGEMENPCSSIIVQSSHPYSFQVFVSLFTLNLTGRKIRSKESWCFADASCFRLLLQLAGR
jgi:hypothetical protein